MDDAVLRAMQRWPNVPAVFGWLQLDRRGNWLIKTVEGRFERIVNSAMVEFVGRNYVHDDEGRWYFQNGPQRVYVTLEYTPWVYRLDDAGRRLITHTGATPKAITRLFMDDSHALLVETEFGIGIVLDRDLSAFLDHVQARSAANVDALIESVSQGAAGRCRVFDWQVPVEPIQAKDVPNRFGFVSRPTPAPGQPDC